MLLDYFDNGWTLTESLFSCIADERGFYEPPHHGLRHPIIFYYGHPAALYVNKLLVSGLLKAPVNAYFEKIFETGVDEMSWDDLSNNGVPWPAVSEVHKYRKDVHDCIVKLINTFSDEQLSSISNSSPLWALVMGFEHERIHLETSSLLINEMSLSLLQKPMHFPPYHSSIQLSQVEFKEPIKGIHYPTNEFIEIDANTVSIGKSTAYPSFGWDNEYGMRTFEVPKFRASKFKVSNGEYYEFVKSGGYSNSQYWTESGWKWRSYKNAKWPQFWVLDGPQGLNKYNLRLMFDIVPMQWAWPVTINFHECDAFAKWKGMMTGKNIRVITELEHNLIRDEHVLMNFKGKQIPVDPVVFSADELMKTANTNAMASSPSSVDFYLPNTKGFYDIYGNSWEWCNDYFSGLNGFEVNRLYEDFSTPCFDGLHNVIMGSSFMSTGNEVSNYSRFHFRPHFLQHASCRMVEQLESEMVTSDTDAPGPYVGSYPFRRSKEGSKKAEYLNKENQIALDLSRFFGKVSTLDFLDQSSLADYVIEAAEAAGLSCNTSNLIEVGCGAGSLSLKLANTFRSVLGIDHNGDHINLAKSVLKGSVLDTYTLPKDCVIVDKRKNNVTFDIAKEAIVNFRQADAMSLPAELQNFDYVFLNDIIDKVASPNSVLGRLGGERGLVKPGGILMIASSFQWKDTVTPKALWLGGYIDKNTNEEVNSATGLANKLSGEFEIISSRKFPLIWHETSCEVRGKIFDIIIFRRLDKQIA